MKKILILFSALFLTLFQTAQAISFEKIIDKTSLFKQEFQIKRLFATQIKSAHNENFEKFISTFDENYLNSDGFNLSTYSELVKEIWKTYDNVKYKITINNIEIDNDKAVVKANEHAYAEIPFSKKYQGELKSETECVYYLKKINGKWKVSSDEILDETTSILYGEAKDLEIKLTVPNNVEPNFEYTVSLEFNPQRDRFAIASIAADKVEYPQTPPKEVFRTMPEDNILERLFISNDENANEYVVATIGLTKTTIEDLSINLSFTGFGYVVKRVNVIEKQEKENNEQAE